MTEMSVRFSSIPGTEAAIGFAGSHALIADRPEGRAGGKNLGFNGGQLLALAVGGCFCNDLHYLAHARGITLSSIDIAVTIRFEGEPLLASDVAMTVRVEAGGGIDTDELIRAAAADSTVGNSLRRGVPVSVTAI